jgi:large subunit ribosomal protein L13
MINTFLPIKTSNNIYKKWYLIDAKEQKLGRLSTKISLLLTGKHKSDYTPSLNKGDYVIVINAKEIQVTGKKEKQKLYRSHSGRPGGMKIKTFTEVKNYFPEKLIEKSVKGMLPNGILGRQFYTQLKIYSDNTHPHIAQNPISIE